jgi:hypothetical protein
MRISRAICVREALAGAAACRQSLSPLEIAPEFDESDRFIKEL